MTRVPALDEIIAPDPLPPNQADAIFILGSVRSGTSVLVNALKDGAGIRGYYESNVAPLMQRLEDVVGEFFQNLAPAYLAAKDHHLIANVDPSAIETWIANYFAAIYASWMGEGRWVSKSPDSYLHAPMIRACHRLARMFPKAKFIFCARRGVENVMSRVRKWPEVPFGHHCQSWAHTFDEWFRLRPVLGERALEVRQRDIATRPHVVADDLKRFLGLSDEERNGVHRVLAGPRHEQTQLPQDYRDIGVDETPWDGNRRAEFLDWCRATMESAGFGLKGRTYSAREPLRLFFPTVREAVHAKDTNPAWGFVEIDRNTFQIHPNPPGQPPAEVRWSNVPLDGESQIAADVCVNHPGAGPVSFGLRLEKSASREVVVAGSYELREAGVWKHLAVNFPPLEGVHDIVLSTQMADGATDASWAWAQFRDAQMR